MNRFEQRLRKRMLQPEFAEGYREMTAEMDLLNALNAAREQLQLTQEEIAARMGKQREAVSRLLRAETANPTLETLTALLSALGLTADITLRKSEADEAPMKVSSQLDA